MSGDDGKNTGAQKGTSVKSNYMKGYLSEHAFMGLLLSSAEVFKRECLGYLLGYRLHDRIIVEYAFGLQSARRKRRGVIFLDRDQKKIVPILEKFSKMQIVGDFHSHTPYGAIKGIAVPSPEDIKGMEEDNVYIIVAVNDLLSTKPWRENRDGSISGSMGNLFFKVSAYYYACKNGNPRRAPIYCPFPPGLKLE